VSDDIPAKLKEQVGRLALRVEGSLWVAYYALPDTMDGAVFLGSIRMQFVIDKVRMEAFKAMMIAAVSDLIFEHHGVRPDWSGTRPAPEHERGGNA
jgi:hypothetical protein